jgi:hypothetical protein
MKHNTNFKLGQEHRNIIRKSAPTKTSYTILQCTKKNIGRREQKRPSGT